MFRIYGTGKIVTMEKFPHTPSGKIDRVGLRKLILLLSKIAPAL